MRLHSLFTVTVLAFLGLGFLPSRVYAQSCNNGVQDGDETGVDCGGSCPGCSVVWDVSLAASATPPRARVGHSTALSADASALYVNSGATTTE